MQKKKNQFLLFILSFCPGAGELYMGFMKMGLSLLSIFFVSIFIVSILNMPELGLIVAIIYIYSFFHAHSIASLDDDKFYALEDDYVFGSDMLDKLSRSIKGKHKKVAATVLILLGLIMMWNSGLEFLHDHFGGQFYLIKVLYEISDYAPRFIIGIAIIICGAMLIKGKKNNENTDN